MNQNKTPCPNCGHDIKEGSTTCGYCGASVTGLDSVQSAAVNPVDPGKAVQLDESGKQEDALALSEPTQESALKPEDIEPDFEASSGPALVLTAESLVNEAETLKSADSNGADSLSGSKSELAPLELTGEIMTVSEDSLLTENVQGSMPGQDAPTLELTPETEINSSAEVNTSPPDDTDAQAFSQGKNETGESPRTIPDEAEALKQQKMAQAKALLEKKALLAQAAALKKQRAAMARAEALKSQEAAALQKKKAALAQAEAAQHSNPAAAKTSVVPKEEMAMTMKPRTRMMELLKKYEGKAIGINYDNSAEIREAELVEANPEYFRICVAAQKLFYNFPLQTILTVVEGEDGVDAGEGGQGEKFNAVIKLYPLVLF